MGTRPRVLLTAFEPYGEWSENASARALETLAAAPPVGIALETRLYPVDHDALPARLGADLAAGPDWALHLGQAPGRARLELEAVARNLRGEGEGEGEDGEGGARPLDPGGPPALRTNAPVEAWARRLRAEGIPAAVSCDAGTFLCNAALYWSLRLGAERGLATRSAFLHLPLTPAQAAGRAEAVPSLPSEWAARGLAVILGALDCDT